MARRRIGQERLGSANTTARDLTSLDEMSALIDWAEIDRLLGSIYAAAKGEPAWPPWRCSERCCSRSGTTSRM